jgi:anti-sigma factor RsiW
MIHPNHHPNADGEAFGAAMSCRELVALVTDYFDDALKPADRLRFEAHLAMCPYWLDYLNQMRRTIEVAGRLSEDNVPAPTLELLLAVFRNWKLSQD